jgi:hypothetical protein
MANTRLSSYEIALATGKGKVVGSAEGASEGVKARKVKFSDYEDFVKKIFVGTKKPDTLPTTPHRFSPDVENVSKLKKAHSLTRQNLKKSVVGTEYNSHSFNAKYGTQRLVNNASNFITRKRQTGE